MNGIKIKEGFIFAIIILFFCLHHLYAETLNRVVAIVNDEVITLHELNKKIKEMTGRAPEDLRLENEDKYLQTRQLILNLLVDDKIAQGKISELGIKVTPKHIDATIEKIKNDNQWTHEDLLVNLDRQGLTYEKYRDNIKKELERIRLINIEVKSKILIREEQIRQYYQEHKETFGTKEEIHLAGIFLIRKNPEDEGELRELHKKGEDILARLKKGEDFGILAVEFSQGPGVNEGGDLGKFKTSQLDPELGKVVENLPEGSVSDLIIRPNGVQIIKLLKKQEGKIKPFEDVRNAIFAILYKEEVNNRYMSWIQELREKSYTKIIF